MFIWVFHRVSGGLAGLSAALIADPRFKVAVISKVHPLRLHSVAAKMIPFAFC